MLIHVVLLIQLSLTMFSFQSSRKDNTHVPLSLSLSFSLSLPFCFPVSFSGSREAWTHLHVCSSGRCSHPRWFRVSVLHCFLSHTSPLHLVQQSACSPMPNTPFSLIPSTRFRMYFWSDENCSKNGKWTAARPSQYEDGYGKKPTRWIEMWKSRTHALFDMPAHPCRMDGCAKAPWTRLTFQVFFL